MSLPARIDHWLLRRHTQSCPWPIGSGAVTTRTKGATMSDPDPIETIAEVIWGTDYDYEQRYRAKCVVSAIRTQPALRRSLWLALTTDNPLSRVSKAPSSPVGESDASARPIPPEEANGLTSGPEGYTERELRFIGAAALDLNLPLEQAARAALGRLMALADDENYRLTIALQDANTKHEILRELDLKSLEAAHTTIAKLDSAGMVLANEVERLEATIARMRTGRP